MEVLELNIQQIAWLKSLDPDRMHGSLQRVLMEDNLSMIPFENTAKYLLNCMMGERKELLQANERMRKALVKANLYTSEVALGREG